jgi:hypothetical protein
VSGLEPELIRVLKLLRETFADIEVLDVRLRWPTGQQRGFGELEAEEQEEPE